MAQGNRRNVRREWEECPREARETRWQAMYVTLNPQGDIVISRFTHEACGQPPAYVLLFDRENKAIGLKPMNSEDVKNAYPARVRGRHGGRRIRGWRLCREFGLKVDRTVRFPSCYLDVDGVLILDLEEARYLKKK